VEFSIGERPYCLVIPRVCKFINLGLRTINWIVTFESIGLTFILFLIIDYLMFEPVRLVFSDGNTAVMAGWNHSLLIRSKERSQLILNIWGITKMVLELRFANLVVTLIS